MNAEYVWRMLITYTYSRAQGSREALGVRNGNAPNGSGYPASPGPNVDRSAAVKSPAAHLFMAGRFWVSGFGFA